MTIVHRHLDATRSAVFAAVSDPTTYPDWLVGAQDIRDVDDDWPAPGARFHHRVGLVGPLTVADSTVALAVDAPRRLELAVRARPFGRGRVTFVLEEEGTGTHLTMDERATGALGHLDPVLAPLIRARNERSLESLASYLASSTTAA